MADFKDLLDDIVNNPDQLDSLSLEEIVEIQRKLDPLGHTVTSTRGKKTYANISIINFREEYHKRMLMTSLIGFIYRQLEEYTPMYDADIARTLEADRKKLLVKYRKEEMEESTASPVSGGKAEVDDSTPKSTADSVSKSADNSAPFKSPYVDDINLTMEEKNVKNAEERGIIKKFLDSIFEYNPDRHVRGAFGAVDKNQPMWAMELRKKMRTNLSDDAAAVAEVEPSAEVFYNWSRYKDNHYEEFIEAVGALYLDQPDLEFAINFYDSFDNEDDSSAHVKKNKDNVIAPIITVENGAWTYLTSRKENRDKVDYDNKDTELLRRMTEKIKEDQSLGKDMMQKRVKYEKKKNILREGPDDESLSKYKSAVTSIAALGAKEGLSKDEREELQKAYFDKEMAEVPEDAIQVDVWGQDSDGVVKRNKFYTQAEAPDYLLEEPQSQQDMKMITSRDGTKKTIGELKASTSQ